MSDSKRDPKEKRTCLFRHQRDQIWMIVFLRDIKLGWLNVLSISHYCCHIQIYDLALIHIKSFSWGKIYIVNTVSSLRKKETFVSSMETEDRDAKNNKKEQRYIFGQKNLHKKWPKNDPKWPKIAQKLSKIAHNGPKMTQTCQNGPKMTKNGPKISTSWKK